MVTPEDPRFILVRDNVLHPIGDLVTCVDFIVSRRIQQVESGGRHPGSLEVWRGAWNAAQAEECMCESSACSLASALSVDLVWPCSKRGLPQPLL